MIALLLAGLLVNTQDTTAARPGDPPVPTPGPSSGSGGGHSLPAGSLPNGGTASPSHGDEPGSSGGTTLNNGPHHGSNPFRVIVVPRVLSAPTAAASRQVAPPVTATVGTGPKPH
jgi:hypothetical protein